MPGQILVKPGQKVTSETVVARTELPGHVSSVNVAGLLGVQPDEVKNQMLKTVGQQVKKDEIIASTKGLFGLFKSQCRAPVDGSIESISDITGQVMIREPEIPVEINAYVDGKIVDIIQDEGVVVQTFGAFIQGIFGIGGEVVGQLNIASDNPGDILNPDKLNEKMAGNVVVGGSLITSDSVKRALDLGIKGIIAGGIDDEDLRKFLGYELGVAITGSEKLGITIIITEGFGKMEMAAKTFNLLKKCENMKVSINGATQIRAGVIRPEVVIPEEQSLDTQKAVDDSISQLVVGADIRIIREPYFGELARVVELPPELQKLETEAKVRVLKVKLMKTNELIVLPRANVEIVG